VFDQALGLLWPRVVTVSTCTLLPGWLKNSTFSVFFSIMGLFCCVSIFNLLFKIERDTFLCNSVFTWVVEC